MEIKHRYEVRARSVNDVSKHAGMFRPLIENLAKTFNLFSIDPEGWMPQEVAFKSFSLYSKLFGFHVLRRIGKSVGKNMEILKSIKTLDEAVLNLDNVYHLNHRQDGKVMYDIETGKIIDSIGHYHAIIINETELSVDVSSPYPCEFDMGLIEEYFKKFIGKKSIHIKHKPGSPCRKNIKNICSYTVSILDF